MADPDKATAPAAPSAKPAAFPRPVGDPSVLLGSAATAIGLTLAALDAEIAKEIAALKDSDTTHADGSTKHAASDSAAHVLMLKKARFELSEAQRGAVSATGALDRFKALIPRAAAAHAAAQKERNA